MTPIINFTNPWAVLIATVLFVLLVYLAKEAKKSAIVLLILSAFMVILTGHAIELASIDVTATELQKTISQCITYDFIFIGLSYLAYLWIDDIEAKANKKKSIDNSLSWFWSKV